MKLPSLSPLILLATSSIVEALITCKSYRDAKCTELSDDWGDIGECNGPAFWSISEYIHCDITVGDHTHTHIDQCKTQSCTELGFGGGYRETNLNIVVAPYMWRHGACRFMGKDRWIRIRCEGTGDTPGSSFDEIQKGITIQITNLPWIQDVWYID